MNIQTNLKIAKAFGAALLCSALLSACGKGAKTSEDNYILSNNMVLVSTEQFGSSGAHAVITNDTKRYANIDIAPTQSSDLFVVSNGSTFFRVDRTYGNIQKYSSNKPGTFITEFSVNDTSPDGTTIPENPQALVIANDNKAYVMRYNSNKVWIVNPSATTEADYKKTGDELDVSAYADTDGKAEPVNGLIVNGKLYLLLQNIDYNKNYNPATAHVIVYDVKTDQQLQAITLPIMNPTKMIYNKTLNKIFIQASGDTYPEYDYTGGIATINPDDDSVATLIDDNATTKAIIDIAIVSDKLGYYIGAEVIKDKDSNLIYLNYLKQFNPSTGAIEPGTISEFDGKDLSDIEVDQNNKLWVASFGESGVYVMDTSTNTIDGSMISTGLPPYNIVFITLP